VQRFSNRTIGFLQQVADLLSKTIDAWDTFRNGDIGYFSGLELASGRSGSSFRVLLTVDKNMLELRDLRQEVENQKRLLENLEREITQHLAQDNNKIAALQQQSGEHTKLLAIITLIFLPISTSFAMFGVDGSVLPFSKSFGNYVLTTACFGAITLLVYTTISNWSWHWDLLKRIPISAVVGERLFRTDGSGMQDGFQDEDIEML